MGSEQSRPSAEGEYHIVLDAENNIHQYLGPPGIDYDAAYHVLHLQVSDWRSTSPTFRLSIDRLVPNSSGFQDLIDWIDDTLHFSFKIPADYPGGRIELLRRIRQLLDEANFLGITNKHVGMLEMNEFLPTIKKSHSKKNNWTPTVPLYGCNTAILQRPQFSPTSVLFKFTVDPEEATVLVVDTKHQQYQTVTGSNPRKFVSTMALPVRIWLRIRFWRNAYSKMKEEKKAEIDALIASAQGGDSDQPVPASTDENQDAMGVDDFIASVQKAIAHRAKAERAAAKRSRKRTNKMKREKEQSIDKDAESEDIPEKTPSEEDEGAKGEKLVERTTKAQTVEEQPTRSKNALKKIAQKKRRRLQKLQAQEAAQQMSEEGESKGESTELHDTIQKGTAALTTQLSDVTIPEFTDSTPFNTASRAPTSPLLSASTEPQPLPPSQKSTSSPVPRVLSPIEANASSPGETGKATSSELELKLHSGNKTPQGSSEEPSRPDRDISLLTETVTTETPTSSDGRSPIPAIEESTTSPTEISTRSERGSPGPIPQLASLPQCDREESIDSVPDSTESVDDVESDSEYSESSDATVKASTAREEIMTRRKSKPGRKKHSRKNQRKHLEEDPRLDTTQEATIQHGETRHQEVEVQDEAVTNAPSPHDSQATPAEPESDPEASDPEKPVKVDKGKARVSDIRMLDSSFCNLDINQLSTGADDLSCAEELSSDADTKTPQPTPRSGQLSPIHESAEDESASHAPVSSANSPSKGESSKHAIRAVRSSSSKAVVPAERTARGASSYATPAKTPSSSKSAVSLGRKKGGASSSRKRTTRATTPGSRTAVSAGRTGIDEFVPGATPAITPGSHTVVPAGRTKGSVADSTSTQPSQPQTQTHAATPAALPTPQSQTEGPSSSGSDQTVVLSSEGPFFYDRNHHMGLFFVDLTTRVFPCAMPGCGKRCSLWDGRTQVCPGCGPLSSVWYCGKEHLREDLLMHWQDCGRYYFQCLVQKNSIPPKLLEGPPEIPSILSWNNPEHHRQATWFANSRDEADYFIFSDWRDQMNMRVPLGSFEWRCSPRVWISVHFSNAVEKDRFRRILAVCLMSSISVQPLVDYMFRLIRDNLSATHQWTPYVDLMLRYQIRFELGVHLPWHITGHRHACETEWNGTSFRHCSDPICTRERAHLLGSEWWRPHFARLCEVMESNHWILRAHRFTHPTVRRVEDRIRGEGFEGVLEEDRRTNFRRGEGWDGWRSGCIEIEHPI